MDDLSENGATQPLIVLVAGKLYAPEEIAGPVAVVLEGPIIRDIWRGMDDADARHHLAEHLRGREVEVLDLRPWSLAPGYLDLHIHGFAGYDVTTGSQEHIEALARELVQVGVTSFFPTIATLDLIETLQQVQRVVACAQKQHHATSAEILGLRMEGPFISRVMKGAQYEPGIRPPDPGEMGMLIEAGQGWLQIVDYAPEEDQEGHFLATLVQHGVLACLGHTAATYEQAIRAIDEGARHTAHLFNAMSGLHHREPGVVGALLSDQRATIEIIADGIHVHPVAIKLALAARGAQSIALVTDAVAPTGLPEGVYDFVGRKITVKEGIARLVDGTLAGSVLTLEQAVKNMVALMGLGWSEALAMATQVPARIAGVTRRKGRITPGADADLVLLSENGIVQQTWIRGLLAFQRSELKQHEEQE